MRKSASDNQRIVSGESNNHTSHQSLPVLLHLATGQSRAVAECELCEPLAPLQSKPMASKPWRAPSPEEQLRAALPVLVRARQDIINGEDPLAAIGDASSGLPPIVYVYARRALNEILGEDVNTWRTRPGAALQSARTRVFDRAIRLARRAFGHRGGWSVSRVAR